jgi:hypothetical protein
VEEEEHSAAERRFWEGQLGEARKLNWITGAAAAVGLGGLLVLGLQLYEAHTATVEANRAWIAPINAILEGPLIKGQPVPVEVIYQNTGKEPAIDTNNGGDSGITMPLSPAEADQQQLVGPFRNAESKCVGVKPRGGSPAIFPTGPVQMSIERTVLADDAILNGSRTFYVEGCIAYNTMGETHTSSYCFWLGRHIDPQTKLRQFQTCIGGFHAN